MKLDKLVQKRFAELEKEADKLPESRTVDFISVEGKKYYNIPFASFKGWGTSVQNLLQRVFGESSVHYQNFSEHYKNFAGSESAFDVCRAIFLAAKVDYEGGYLFSIRALVKAEVVDDALEQAKALLQSGYKDPACILAGISLEITLKEICAREGVAHSKLDKMNTDLCKVGVYNLAKQKQVTAWADLRNKAAHGDWTAYNVADVDDFIKGIERFIADYL